MAKKTAKAKTAKKAAKKAAGQRKTNNKREAVLNFIGQRQGGKQSRLQAAAAKLARGRARTTGMVAVAGQTRTRGGKAVLNRRQTKGRLNVAGSRFYDQNGKRVSVDKAFTKNGALRSGFQVERTVGGRRAVVVGGGQNG